MAHSKNGLTVIPDASPSPSHIRGLETKAHLDKQKEIRVLGLRGLTVPLPDMVVSEIDTHFA